MASERVLHNILWTERCLRFGRYGHMPYVTQDPPFLLQVLCAVAESHGPLCLCGGVLREYCDCPLYCCWLSGGTVASLGGRSLPDALEGGSEV
jgi:hypothetical protein